MNAPVNSGRLGTLRRLYVEHAATVRAVARGRGVPEAAVDDVVHDVFLAVHRRLGAREPPLPSRRWVIGVARNVAFAHRRAAARRSRRQASVDPPEPVGPIDEEQLDARRAWAEVRAFLEQLPAAQCEAFMLCQIQRLPASEVAAASGCSTNTVHSRLRLARQRFAAHFPDAAGLDDYEGLLRTARLGAASTKAEHRRAWAIVAAELTRSSGMVAVLGSWSAVAVVCGSILAASTWAGAALSDPSRPAHSPRAAAVAAVELAPRPVEQAPALPDAPAIEDTPTPIEDTTTPTASPARTSPTRASPVEAKASDRLREETALLAGARAKLNEGDARSALDLLRRHDAAFPRGTLVIERHRLEVDVLCRLGQRDEARAALARLDAIAPDRAKGVVRCSE